MKLDDRNPWPIIRWAAGLAVCAFAGVAALSWKQPKPDDSAVRPYFKRELKKQAGSVESAENALSHMTISGEAALGLEKVKEEKSELERLIKSCQGLIPEEDVRVIISMAKSDSLMSRINRERREREKQDQAAAEKTRLDEQDLADQRIRHQAQPIPSATPPTDHRFPAGLKQAGNSSTIPGGMHPK